jgi:molybdenum cofactor cytidylyltransferase
VRVVAAVLAAGASVRLGRPKQLLEYRGEPLIRHAVRVAMGAGCHDTLVIVPPNTFTEALQGLDVTVVENAEWRKGVSSSIRAAVLAAPDSRILFTLCDQPLVTSEHLQDVIAVDAPIVATEYRGVTGVPAAFGPQFAAQLSALEGDHGARSIITSNRESVVPIRLEEAGVDIDTFDDYLKL